MHLLLSEQQAIYTEESSICMLNIQITHKQRFLLIPVHRFIQVAKIQL